MIASDTATKKGISNYPPKEVQAHLDELMDYLDIIRAAWGSPIIVTSGYRCPELNAAVGGSKTSVHTLGWAVDMHPKYGTSKQLFDFILKFMREHSMAFDQLIDEYNYSWVHLGIKSRNGYQRKQVLHIK